MGLNRFAAVCQNRHITELNEPVVITLLAIKHLSKWKALNRQLFIDTEGVVLLDDNACPHVSRVTRVELAKFKWEQLDHPPYNPDMSHCNFHVFSPLKKYRKGKRFNSDEKLKGVVSRHGRRNSSVRQLMGSLCLGLWCIL
ncbi:UNVERIFIED_CONTAM: Histone-lysine N-methyltransferase SETMAR [Trichonephila clavipes]